METNRHTGEDGAMMICSRCGTRCPPRPDGLCFHCHVAEGIEKAIGKPLAEAGISEGFPDYHKPKKGDKPRGEMLL